MSLPAPLVTVLLLTASNLFMTVAWYGHLRFKSAPLIVAILISWGIAFFEYLIQVPTNRYGYAHFSGAQLKIMQEVVALGVFVPFAIFYLKEPFKLNYLWACLCILGALFFILRE